MRRCKLKNHRRSHLIRLLFNNVILFLFTLTLSACTVGPDYVKPTVPVPMKYKEASKHWKVAQPCDDIDRGDWWKVFNNAELNALEPQVNISNQNLAAAIAAYEQARALVDEAAANYFPTLMAAFSEIRQKQSALVRGVSVSSSSNSTTGVNTTTVNGRTNTNYTVGLQASWVPDLWGAVRRQVEQNATAAQASAAQIESARLSAQATLAQDYFQLRGLDLDQQILDNTVIADKKAFDLTKRGFVAGTSSLANIEQAVATLKTVQVAALDNHIARAQFEHAIAVLIGKNPEAFSIKPKIISLVPPPIPLEIPSMLLERRPDIAAAERQVASANAGIGVTIAAYFPSLMLSATYGFQTYEYTHWFSQPMLFWSIGPQLAETILDGGLRIAKTAAARAVYNQSVATYRQTVLAAFQNVEDNLVALRVLNSEVATQHQAVMANEKALELLLDEYKAGTVAYTSVIVGQTNTLAAQKAETDIASRRMVAAVGLIEALGGSWNAEAIAKM